MTKEVFTLENTVCRVTKTVQKAFSVKTTASQTLAASDTHNLEQLQNAVLLFFVNSCSHKLGLNRLGEAI